MSLTTPTHLLSREELLKLVTLFASEGVDKVRLTGGEPLVRRDILDIVSELTGQTGHTGYSQ